MTEPVYRQAPWPPCRPGEDALRSLGGARAHRLRKCSARRFGSAAALALRGLGGAALRRHRLRGRMAPQGKAIHP